MGLQDILNTEKKNLLYVSLGLIAISVFVDFIVSVVWYSRLHPWFNYGWGSGKTVYDSLTVCWIFSLFSLLAIIALPIFYFFIQTIFEKISYNNIYSILCISALSFMSFCIFISGMIASCYGLKNQKIDDEPWKCYQYMVDGFAGDALWLAYHQDKFKKFDEYYDEIWDKMWNDEGEPTNYLCAAVAAPLLLFCLFLLAGWVIFFYIAFPIMRESPPTQADEYAAI